MLKKVSTATGNRTRGRRMGIFHFTTKLPPFGCWRGKGKNINSQSNMQIILLSNRSMQIILLSLRYILFLVAIAKDRPFRVYPCCGALQLIEKG